METLTKKSLFWDVNTLDPVKNKKFIIERILNYGDEVDFCWAKETYGDKKIKEALLKSRALDKKSLSFWCQYFKLDQNRCLENQSARRPSGFSKR